MNDDMKKRQFLLEGIFGLIILLVLMVSAFWLLIRRANPVQESVATVATVSNTEMDDEVTSAEYASSTDAAQLDTDDEVSDIAVIVKPKPVEGEMQHRFVAGIAKEYTGDDYQLPELSGYWGQYALDAVEDIIRLERLMVITDSLGESNDYYYYGDKDASGLANGKGIAVYAYHTYYYGDWSNGKRDGDGMWIRLFPNGDGIVNGISGVVEHQYSGKWKEDYPYGEGQENITYKEGTAIDKEAFAFRNVIGSFKNGYYDGNMYLMTENGDGSTTDWYGNAQNGCFVTVSKKKGYGGKIAIWEVGEGYETDEEGGYHWIAPGDNIDFGIAGLKK